MAFDLKDKIVLVTGGASGIGFSCVKELLRNGAQVCINNKLQQCQLKNVLQ